MVPLRVLEELGIRPTKEGSLQIRTWSEKDGQLVARWVTIKRKPRLEAAIRMQRHVLAGYGYSTNMDEEGGEVQELAHLVEVLDFIDGSLAEWRRADLLTREQLKRRLSFLCRKLARVINSLKREALEQLLTANIKDSRDRYNPGALRAQLVAVRSRLEKRLEEIYDAIVPVISLREQALLIERASIRSEVFSPAIRKFEAILGSTNVRKKEAWPLIRALDRLELPQVRYEPYRDMRNALMSLKIGARRRLQEENWPMALTLLRQACDLATAAKRQLELTPEQVGRLHENKRRRQYN